MSRSRQGGKHPHHDRAWNDRGIAARERDERRLADAGDPVCSCGWITALDTCPNCGGAR